MAEHFGAYSQYYDLLYADKNYVGEANYIRSLLNQFGDQPSTVLELGTGTGRHAELLAESGLHVDGVEVSNTMLAAASERSRRAAERKLAGSFQVHAGDARSFRIDKMFDAVVSLFHVVSYQTSNADVRAMFETVSSHLRPDGLFIFDVWFGPAVVTTRPEVRVKRMENDACSLIRIAEPTLDLNRNRVDVGYTMLVTNKANGEASQFTENHPMRYFFPLELDMVANQSGLEIVDSEEWLTGAEPSSDTWGVVFVAKKCKS